MFENIVSYLNSQLGAGWRIYQDLNATETSNDETLIEGVFRAMSGSTDSGVDGDTSIVKTTSFAIEFKMPEKNYTQKMQDLINVLSDNQGHQLNDEVNNTLGMITFSSYPVASGSRFLSGFNYYQKVIVTGEIIETNALQNSNALEIKIGASTASMLTFNGLIQADLDYGITSEASLPITSNIPKINPIQVNKGVKLTFNLLDTSAHHLLATYLNENLNNPIYLQFKYKDIFEFTEKYYLADHGLTYSFVANNFAVGSLIIVRGD